MEKCGSSTTGAAKVHDPAAPVALKLTAPVGVKAVLFPTSVALKTSG